MISPPRMSAAIRPSSTRGRRGRLLRCARNDAVPRHCEARSAVAISRGPHRPPRNDAVPRHCEAHSAVAISRKPHRPRGLRALAGFTLLEVMVALLVIAIGLGAVINTTSETRWKAGILKEKTIAGWVAQNEIARYRAKRTWSNRSNLKGATSMAGAEWEWNMRISATDDPSLRRIDIDVFLRGEDDVKASLTGFIAKL